MREIAVFIFRSFRLAVILVLVTIFPGWTAFAVPGSQTIGFNGGRMGRVIFDGKVHAQNGNKCTSCHPAYFLMKRSDSAATYADHVEGRKSCFACHNGERAFSPADHCSRCHKRTG